MFLDKGCESCVFLCTPFFTANVRVHSMAPSLGTLLASFARDLTSDLSPLVAKVTL
jgi:hypothetical protein